MRRIAEVSDSALCLKLAKEAYHFYVKHGGTNPANESYLLIGIGESYRRRRDSDSTLYYYNKALDKATLSGDSIAIGSVIQNIAFHFLHYKQYDTALDYANKSLSYQKTFNKSLLKLMALCYIQKSEYEVAQQYINALPSNASKEDQLVKLGMLHRLCAKTGDADATQEYFDSACNVAADMYLSTLKEKLELHRKNLTWLIYPLNLMMKGLLQRGTVVVNYNALVDENSIRNLNFRDCDVIVLNDEYQDNFFTGKPLLINRLEEVLPGKSEFEK